MNTTTTWRQLVRLSVTGIACAAALTGSMVGRASAVTPATTTGDRCTAGDFCLFGGSDAKGGMTVYRKSAPDLGTAGTHARSWVNRSKDYSCVFPGKNYTVPSGSSYASWSSDPASGGNFAWDNTSSVPGSQGHLASVFLAPTSHECLSGGKEYLSWSEVQDGDGSAKPFGSFMGNGSPQVLMRSVEGNLWLLPGSYDPGIKLGTGWNGMTLLARHGDFTGDGREDVIARSSTGHLYVYPGQGTSLGTRRDLGGGWNAMTAVVAPGDLNGDAHSDLLARDKSGTLWDYPGTTKGTFGVRHAAATKVPQSVKLFAVGDIDGDGKNDLYAADGPFLDLYSGTGTGTFQHSKNYWQTYMGLDAREPLF